jgi:hypothetical protein
MTLKNIEHRCLPNFPLPQPEPPDLCKISAILHNAPMPAVVLACVDKKPPAFLAAAFLHPA